MEKIKQWRRDNSLSLEQAGKLIGVSGVQWHRYEAGTRRLPAEKVVAVASVTGIPARELRPDLADLFPEGAAA